MYYGGIMSKIHMHHAHLFASDLDASIAYYQRWFGAEVLADTMFAGSRNVMVRIGDGRLNFYDQAPKGTGPSAVHHLGFEVEDLTTLVAEMKAGGVAFRSDIRESAEGRYIMAPAPDGVLLELFELKLENLPAGVQRWSMLSDRG